MALQAGHLCTPRPKVVVSLYGFGDIIESWWAAPHPGDFKVSGVPIQKAFDMEDEILKFFAKDKTPVSGVPFIGDDNPREMLYHYVIGKGTRESREAEHGYI